MTERDVPFLQGGNYTAAEVRRIVSALTGAPDFVDLNPSTSPLVSAGGGHGVVGSTDMTVTAGAGTTVNVAAGLALVRGTQQSDQGVYVTSNDAAKNLTISAADATNPRKDLIVSRVKDAEYGIAGDTGPLEVVSGTPTGGLTAGDATGRPTPPENALVLAEVFVPAGAASSASYTITDLRTRAYALGGVGVCKSTTRPSTTFEGQVIYETDTDKLLVYSGATWLWVPESGTKPIARRRATAGQGVASTEVVVTFPTEDEAAAAYVTYSAGVFTAVKAGLFRVTYSVNTDAMTSAGVRAAHIKLGTTTAGTAVASQEVSSSGVTRFTISKTIRLAAAATFVCTLFSNTNGNTAVSGNTPACDVEYLGA